MRNLPALFVTAALVALNTTAIAQPPPGSLWYNGDFNGVNGLANQRYAASVYDDFNVTDPSGWNVTAVFSDNLAVTVDSAADWEIRTGISEGNAGTLIASGTTNSPIVIPTGRSGFGYTEYMVEVTGLNVFLPMLPPGQHYWLNVTPGGYATGRSFNSTTSGANCVGSPCGNDDNSFFNSTFFGAFFDHASNYVGYPADFSNGVIGTVVPEPTTVALLTCGLGALLIAVRYWRRARLLALLVATALVVNTNSIAQAPPGSLWYNGDFNGVNGLANERNTIVSQAAVYDDFNVTAPQGWHVTAVFSCNLTPYPPPSAGADWEIRTGISEGDAGTLIAGGTTNSPLVIDTGRGGFGLLEFMFEVTGLNIFLPMLPTGQHYWLNVTPVGNGTGRSFNSTTSGANCVGTPCGNDQNAFFNSTYFGYYFSSTGNPNLGQPYDFSNGVIGTVVPEPATLALLTCGLGALLIASRRRRGAQSRRSPRRRVAGSKPASRISLR